MEDSKGSRSVANPVEHYAQGMLVEERRNLNRMLLQEKG
jgi:hypothetical protein